MIGVISSEYAKAVVIEFFELFKTPWEFYKRGNSYDVIIATKEFIPLNETGLTIIFNSEKTNFDKEHGIGLAPEKKYLMATSGEQEYPLYCKKCVLNCNNRRLVEICEQKKAVGIEVIKNEYRYIRIGYDLFDEIRYLLVEGQPVEYGTIPTLDIHIALLRKWIIETKRPFVEVMPVPAGHEFMVSLTHDVDFVYIGNHLFDKTFFGFLYRGLFITLIEFIKGNASFKKLVMNWWAVATLPFIYLKVLEDIWLQFEQYAEIEKGLPATYYFVPFKGKNGSALPNADSSGRAVKYDLDNIRNDIRKISSENEIGVHGIDAWHDESLALEEKKRVSQNSDRNVSGVRMHWLYFKKDTALILEKAGFKYDSTFGYNETVGYRAGTSQVFSPIGSIEIMELPLHIMDTSLFYSGRLGLSESEANKKVDSIIDNAKMYGGVITVNWHHRSIAPERLWGPFYQKLITKFKHNNACFNTALMTTDWFRKRRSVEFKKTKLKNGVLNIQLECQEFDGQELVLRVYNIKSQDKISKNIDKFKTSKMDINFSTPVNVTLKLDDNDDDKK